MNKLIEFRRAKVLTLSLLLTAAVTSVATLFLPSNFWVSGVKAIAEAVMVDALADWFVVAALFHRVPIPIISRRTTIIPRNKDRIGKNPGQFVQKKFLDTQSLVVLIRRHEPALLISNWSSQPENVRRVGQHLLQIMSGFLELTNDAHIQCLLKRAVHRVIDKVDPSGISVLMPESMTRNDRHQVLFDTLIAQLIALLRRDKPRKFIAQQIVRWLESEHPPKVEILPAEWLGEHSAELVSDAVNSLPDDISRDRVHQIRHAFDYATFVLIGKLESDLETTVRADAVKSYLKEDEVFNRYLSELWGDLWERLKADINSEDFRVKERTARAGQWFGETLTADDTLWAPLNGHPEQTAHCVAPESSAFLTRHINDTVKSQDIRGVSRQIELNTGKDLQPIRVNGTLIGGCIGLILYLLSQLPVLFPLGNLQKFMKN